MHPARSSSGWERLLTRAALLLVLSTTCLTATAVDAGGAATATAAVAAAAGGPATAAPLPPGGASGSGGGGRPVVASPTSPPGTYLPRRGTFPARATTRPPGEEPPTLTPGGQPPLPTQGGQSPPPPPSPSPSPSSSPSTSPPPAATGLPIPPGPNGCDSVGVRLLPRPLFDNFLTLWTLDGGVFVTCESDDFPPPVTNARVRVLSIPSDGAGAGGGAGGREVVVWEGVASPRGFSPIGPRGGLRLRLGCTPRTLVVEACVAAPPGGRGEPNCTRSEPAVLPILPPPRVLMTNPLPPRRLALAPGDSVRTSTSFTVLYDDFRPLQAERAIPPAEPPTLPDLRLVAVVRRADNSTCRSPPVNNVTTITNTLLAGGVTTADDGAVSYVELSRFECPVGIAQVLRTDLAFPGAGITNFSVSADTPSLVKQDERAPNITSVVYPPTAVRSPVTITATATGNGGGRRRAGGSINATVPTVLTYQWYSQPRSRARFSAVPPVLLPNETQSTLRLPSARPPCGLADCGPVRGVFTCLFSPQWQVDVCNTGGCTRSPVVEAAVLRPPPTDNFADPLFRCRFVDADGNRIL